VLVVVVVAEREQPVNDHLAAVQLGDQPGQAIGVNVITQRVEVDDDLVPGERRRHAAAQQRERGDSRGLQRNERGAGDRPARIEVRSHTAVTDERPLVIPGCDTIAAMATLRASSIPVLVLLAGSLACTDDGSDDMVGDDDVGVTISDSGSDESDDESGTSESGTDDATETSTDDATETATDDTSESSTDDTSESSESEGSESSDDTTETSTDDTTSESTTTTESGGDCLMCGVTLDSTQSSSFDALPGTEFLGYATLEGDQIIYALDEVGNGRVIYTADTNILYKEITDCPLWEWLGQTGDTLPKVLSFGRYLCDGVGNDLGMYPDLTYAGNNLPAQFINNPAALAQEYDAVIYCTLAGTSAAEAQTIVDYVTDHGGGLYLASEYWGFLNQNDLNTINMIGNPLGVEFKATNLDWGQANGDIDFACFPDPQ
jgi:hypothetical protein